MHVARRPRVPVLLLEAARNAPARLTPLNVAHGAPLPAITAFPTSQLASLAAQPANRAAEQTTASLLVSVREWR